VGGCPLFKEPPSGKRSRHVKIMAGLRLNSLEPIREVLESDESDVIH
jgi:hypothetical protein